MRISTLTETLPPSCDSELRHQKHREAFPFYPLRRRARRSGQLKSPCALALRQPGLLLPNMTRCQERLAELDIRPHAERPQPEDRVSALEGIRFAKLVAWFIESEPFSVVLVGKGILSQMRLERDLTASYGAAYPCQCERAWALGALHHRFVRQSFIPASLQASALGWKALIWSPRGTGITIDS